MKLEDYFEFLESGTREPRSSRAIRIRGHRLGVEHVLRYYLDGYNPDDIARAFPGLTLETIYATITYYLGHRAEMDKYMARIRWEDEQAYQQWATQPQTPAVQRLRALRETGPQG